MRIEHFVNYGTINEFSDNAVQYINKYSPTERPKKNEREAKFNAAVKAMYDRDIIRKKNEWAAVKRVLEDNHIYDKLQNTSFVAMLKDAGIPEDALPTDSTLGKVIFKNRPYSFWEIIDRQPNDVKRFVKVAEEFMELYTLNDK